MKRLASLTAALAAVALAGQPACGNVLGLDQVQDGHPTATTSAGGAGVGGAATTTTAVGQGGGATTSSASSGSGGEGGGPGGDCAYAEMVKGDSPLAYWRLAEPLGAGQAIDQVAGHVGTYAGPFEPRASIIPNCPNDGAVGMSEIDNKIRVGDLFDFAGNVSFTIEAWIDTTSDATAGPLVSKLGAEGWALQLRTGSTSKQVGLLRRTNSNGDEDDHEDIAAGVYHVVGRYSEADGRICTFVNSVDTGCDDSIGALPDSALDLVIGDGGFLGTIDDVAIYDKPLSDARILEHYNAGMVQGL